MSRIIERNHEYFFLSFLVLFFLGGRRVEFGREAVFFQEFPIPRPVIRIALDLNLEDVHIDASSGMKIYRVAEDYQLLAEDASEVRVKDGKDQGVRVNDELVDLDEGASLYLIPANPHGRLTYGGKNYRGIFVLRGSLKGTILINMLNLEDYLKGVVPGELPPHFFGEIEALKAQAVAARTYALKNLGRFGELGFDLYATPRSQLYEGMSLEHPLSNRAVEETKGEVAVYDGKLINALYTSTCGGATENAEAVFGGNAVPYLQSTECVMENEWQDRTSREEIEARLNEYYPIGKLIDLVPVKHGESKRVIELSIIGSERRILVTGLKIRQVLNLRDTLFVIDRETDEEGLPAHFIFSGRGWGHGVGLCQVGAFRMARNGATYEEILSNYYRGIKIEKRMGY
jgi:stage II sporulation protein D